ncbi:MAG: type IV pilin protein [Gammaproteobacteria bacterium]
MKRQNSGFTLIELMVAVAVIGILLAIAFPSYQNNVRESRRADGYSVLLNTAVNQERYFTENNTYNAAMTATSGEGYYSVSSAACAGSTINSCVVMSAAAQGAQASDSSCTPLTLDSRGVKGPANCW